MRSTKASRSRRIPHAAGEHEQEGEAAALLGFLRLSSNRMGVTTSEVRIDSSSCESDSTGVTALAAFEEAKDASCWSAEKPWVSMVML